jgi:hypothetical protein
LRRCSDHGLTRDKERQFPPKICDFDYAEKNNPETDKETEQYSTDGYSSYQSSDSIDSDDTSTKTISADNAKKQNNIVLMAICHINQVTVSTQMILQLNLSVLTMEPRMQMMELSSTQGMPLNTL